MTETKDQIEVKRLLGELGACHRTTLECYKDIAGLKHELKDLRDKFKSQAEGILQSDILLGQQTAIINQLQQRLQNRITVTTNFLRELQHVEDENGESLRLSDMT